MHSAVMQNKKYIKFAEKNTVEVISLQDLQKGIDAKDRRAATYRPKGSDVEYLVEFPGLTVEDMLGLHKSPASRYNKTGKFPYTALIDPHTQNEIGRGYRSAKAIMEAAADARKALVKQHGKGLDRKTLKRVDTAVARANTLLATKQYAKAVASIAKEESRKGQDWPAALSGRLEKALGAIVDAARKELDEAEVLLAEDPVKGKRALGNLLGRLRGTGLEAQARDLMKSTGGKRP